jgi:polyhydroxybutyrate depolymerase
MVHRKRAAFCMATVFLLTLQGCLTANTNTGAEGSESEQERFPNHDPDAYECFVHDDWERCYITHIPEVVDASSKAPLIVELHGWAGSAFETRALTDVTLLADEVGAIVVHAEGILVENTTLDMGGNEESWNAGYCCGDALYHEIDDVGYLRAVIARTVEAYPVDENRIYITGWSNGCMMAQRMALQASDLVAAVACTSGYLSIHEAEGYTPVPVMEIHGFVDENTHYTNTVNWGIVDENRRNLESMQTGAVENMYDWAAYNDCEGSVPDRNEPGAIYTVQGFTNCAAGTEVALITVHSGGHNLYPNDACTPDFVWNCFGSQGLWDVNQLEWEFLSRFSKETAS